MIIEVSQHHIDQGIPFQTRHCPIALAMQDNGFENVQVDPCFVYYKDTPKIRMDILIGKWMNDFDGGKEVFPIQIKVDEDGRNATLVE